MNRSSEMLHFAKASQILSEGTSQFFLHQMVKNVAGESFVAKQNTHRPGLTRVIGLRTRAKGTFRISQTTM